MPTTRREMLCGLSAFGSMAAQSPSHAAGIGDLQATALLDAIAEELLSDVPENAAHLGADQGARAILKSRFSDRSRTAERRRALRCETRLVQLKALDRSRLSPSVALNLDVCRAAHEIAHEGWRTMRVGHVATLDGVMNYRSTPYVVSQNTGAYLDLSAALVRQSVADAAEADAYLSRLEAYGAALNDESERLSEDQSKGAILPGFNMDIAVRQLTTSRTQPVGQWKIVEGFAHKCAAAGLPSTYAERAQRICTDAIVPALGRQIGIFGASRSAASDVPGVWKIPDGEACYNWLLKANTTTTRTPEELHRIGMEQSRALNAELDVLLRAQGMSQGSVGERLAALSRRPDLVFSDDDAGRAAILAYCNDRIADMRTRLPRAFAHLVSANLVIERVPPEIEDGAGSGYGAPGSIDGRRPGIYAINLKDTSVWPRYALPTICYHEGVPGHIWQGEYSKTLPMIRSIMAFNAYSEGWALYAEQLGDELGAYEGDPLGRIGYLQSASLHASRLVIDTGIHAKRWSFDQALNWFTEATGQQSSRLVREIQRFASWPGQGCGYKAGHNEINRLRNQARAGLGARFDLRQFDDAIVENGNMPITLLEQVVHRSVTGAAARTPGGAV